MPANDPLRLGKVTCEPPRHAATSMPRIAALPGARVARAPGYRGQLQLQPQLPCDPVPEPPPPIGGSVIGGSQVARRSSSFSTSRFRCFMMPPPIRYKVTRRNQRGKAPVDGGNRHASVGDWTGVTLERRCTEATARGERNTGCVVDGVQA